MVRKVEDIQIAHHLALLKMRCQDRIIQSDDFIIAWERADNKQRKACYRLLRKLEIDKLKEWVSDEYSVTTLRRLASNHSVKNYCNLTKFQLLEVLTSQGIIHGKTKCSAGRDEKISSSSGSAKKSNKT